MIERLRLLKVLVQPMLVLDDGETLREVGCPAIPVAASKFREWAAGAFDEAHLAELQATVVEGA